MIRSNLAVLLAERGRTITSVSKATGISRTTLTALEKNRASGIQFDTINRLCGYLHVRPSDIISYIPLEVIACKIKPHGKVDIKELSTGGHLVQYKESISFKVTDQVRASEFLLDFDSETSAVLDNDTLNVTMLFSLKGADRGTLERAKFLFSQIPPAFIPSIENDFSGTHAAISTPICDMREKHIEESSPLKREYTIKWPPEILFY